jgi:hypothetical protein
MIMKYLLITLFSAFSLHSFSQTVINDKNVEVRNVSAFSGIKVSGAIDVYLSQSDTYAVAVSADEEKYRDNINTEISNGILHISFSNSGLRFNGDKHLRVYISFKNLQSIEATGASDIIVSDLLKISDLKLRLSGASNITGNVSIGNLLLDLSGASTVKIKGETTNLKIDASGASDVKNYGLVAENCIADISGASDVRITVTKSISAKASGASNLYYRGNPERKDVSSSGASNISRRD